MFYLPAQVLHTDDGVHVCGDVGVNVGGDVGGDVGVGVDVDIDALATSSYSQTMFLGFPRRIWSCI